MAAASVQPGQFECPRVDKSCDVIADSLPTDLAMEARVECAAILSKKHVCGGCQTSPATSICLNCGDMMCAVCSKSHKNFSSTKHHDVEDLATMTAERLAANRRFSCSVHANMTSDLYCPTHGAAICHLCATSKHRACPEVTELEEKMQEARAVLAELAATLKAGESKLEGAISELDQYLVDMEKTTQAALADIDHKCDRLQSSVETCRKRVTGDMAASQAVGQVTATIWRFHTNHGKNIVLSNNQQTAERVRKYDDAIVISSEAMTTNTLYEVRLDAVEGDTTFSILVFGVTVGDPATLTLPSGPGGWTQAVVIGYDFVWQYGPGNITVDIAKLLKDDSTARPRKTAEE
nr:hypothetical protein BaRGS_026695 [Batillaria attramentaria]